MIHVIAIITAQPGKRDAVLDAFRANMPNVHAEDGCIEYVPVVDAAAAGPMQSPIGNDSFIVVEKWSSMDALKAHAAAPHMAAYAATVKPFLASRVIHILAPAG